MSARAKENKIELMVQSEDFNRQVGLINNYYDLEWLGLTGQDFSGAFGSWHLPQLIDFCRENPEYHIVSSDGPGRFVNCLLPDKVQYMIANKDNDPALVLNYLLDPQWPLLWEDGISSALAELDNIKKCTHKT